MIGEASGTIFLVLEVSWRVRNVWLAGLIPLSEVTVEMEGFRRVQTFGNAGDVSLHETVEFRRVLT